MSNGFPTTPAGQQMAAFFEMFNRGDAQAVRTFIADHYADPLADKGPAEDRAVWNSLDYTTALVLAIEFKPDSGLRLHSVEVSKDYEISVLAECGLVGEWLYIRMKVDPVTHRLVEFRTRPAVIPIPAASTSDEVVVAELDDFLLYLAIADIFAGSVIVARYSERIYERSFGLASREFAVPNRLDTKFNIGSLNKVITAVAIAKLVEQGKLTYDDTVSQHLPDLGFPGADQITIHHLLTHLGGVGSYWNKNFETRRVYVRTVSDFLDLFIDQPLVEEPGQKWFYSNGGYVLLGVIIERITGKSYYDFVHHSIHLPAGMLNTDAFEVDRVVPNLAVGYTYIDHDGLRDVGEIRNNLFMHVVKGGPGGGGFSTVEDLIRFEAALRNNTLITAESANLIMRGKVELRGAAVQYAYGLYDRQINGKRVVGHSGTFPGIGAQFELFPDTGHTVAILSNVDPAASQVIIEHLRHKLTAS